VSIHHHPGLGHDKPGIDDVAAVGPGEIIRAAFQQPGVGGDLPGLEGVVEVGQRGQAQAE
jgi:hypothetical protein